MCKSQPGIVTHACTLRKLKQGDCHKFEASLGYGVKSYLKTIKKEVLFHASADEP